jgi:hypothetical protein
MKNCPLWGIQPVFNRKQLFNLKPTTLLCMHLFNDKAWQTEDVFEMFGQNSRQFFASKQGEKIITTCPEMSGFGEFT